MTDRAERLFDCITELDPSYVEDALTFVPARRIIPWRRWGAMAAAVLLVVSMGQFFPRMGGSAKSEAPESAPAAGAQDHSEISSMESIQDSVTGTSDTESSSLRGAFATGVEIYLSPTETATVLAREEAARLGYPAELAAIAEGKPLIWLTWDETQYVLCEYPTGIGLYEYDINLYVISDGDQYWAAAVLTP